jgi:hypothetical protein
LRNALSLVAAFLIAATAAAPHVHTLDPMGPEGGHACLGCVTRAGEEAREATPGAEPVLVAADLPPPAEGPRRDAGFPQGAVSGQSPPCA